MTFRTRTVDIIFGAVELLVELPALPRKLRQWSRRAARDTEPSMPLTHQHAQRINDFAHRAGHEHRESHPEIPPPRVPRS